MPSDLPVDPHGPTRAEILALRVLQAGAVLVVLVAATYRTFELDRFFIPKELLLHLTALFAALLGAGAVRRAAATRVDVLLAAFLALGALSAALATNPWAAGRALAISVSGVVVFWVARGLREAGLSRPLLVWLAVAAALAAATSLLQAYGVETDFFSENRAPGGTLGNRNFIAHLAAFGLPLVLLAALRAWRPLGFLLGAGGAALAVGTLVLTRSRAGWLAAVAAMAVLLLGLLLSPPVRRSGAVRLRAALLVLLLLGGAAAAIVLPNDLRWRSDSPYLETARGVVNYREGSGRGRLVQYRTSLGLAASHPLLGVGPGNWSVQYPAVAGPRDPSMDGDDRGMTANPWPSSDWVALVAERGIPALLTFVLAGAGILVAAWRRLRGARDADEGLPAAALAALVTGVAVAGAFDAVLLLAWPTLIFWAAAGALLPAEALREVRVAPAARAGVLLALALLSGMGALRSAGQTAAMMLYDADRSRESLELAARLDPGAYRIHLRLAQRARGNRARRCRHALAAHRLHPEARQAERLARGCE